MNAKELLNSIQAYIYRIYICDEEIERLKSKLDIQGISYDKSKVQTSSHDSFTDLEAKIIDLERENEERRSKLEEERDRIIKMIIGLDNPFYSAVLYDRYVKGYNLLCIAEKHHYSYDYIRHIHGAALQAFRDKYNTL